MANFLPCIQFSNCYHYFMNLEKPIPATLIFIFLPLLAWAQTDYVVKVSGDTLKGTVKLLPYDQIERVQIISGGSKTIFTALQVRAAGKDNNVFKGVKYDNSVRFMKVIKSGYLSLYAFNTEHQNSWNDLFLTKLDGTGMEVPNLSFKKTLGKYLSDCPNVKNRIDAGDLTKRDLDRIVDLYNACLQTRTEAANSKTVDPAMIDSEKVLAVNNLMTKVEAENFVTKKDALDVLKDIQSKVKKNEPVPNYLLEGLKSYLLETPSLSKDLESLLVLLKK
jgi:hypothetical protein